MSIAAGDFTEQYFPLRAFTAVEWVHYQNPLWNPYLFGGQPALADIQSGALYPIHVIQSLVLGWGGPLIGQPTGFPIKALEWQVILHFSLVAVGTYLFIRYLALYHNLSLRQARFGGVIASIVFTYSGYLTGFPVQQITILQASAWLPWILWGLLAGCRDVSLYVMKERNIYGVFQPLALTALAFAMAILAGHPQTVMYIFYVSLAYVLFLAFNISHFSRRLIFSRQWLVRLVWHLGFWFVSIALGVALSAAQLLPTLEFISLSLRSDLSYQAVSAGLPLTELISILYPGFFGGSPEYVGIVSLVLIALALTLAWSLAKPPAAQNESLQINPSYALAPHVFFWLGAGLVSLLLAFGNNLFLYPFVYLLLPGFDTVRQQERAFLLFSFSASLLAGYGAMLLLQPLTKPAQRAYSRFERNLRVIAVVALFVTGLFVYGSTASFARGDEVNLFYGVLWHHLFGLLMLAGIVVLLMLRPRRWLRRWWGMVLIAGLLAFNLFTVNWQFNLESPEEPPLFTPNGVTQFLQTSLENTPGRIVSGGLLPGGNSASSVFNLEDLTGNTPLQLASVDQFMQQMPAWRLWQLMNVRYIVDTRDIGDAGLQPVFAEDDLTVYQMGDPFERAWFVSEVEVIMDNEKATARLASDDFDLRNSAVVATPVNESLERVSTATVNVQKISPTLLRLDTGTSGNHFLVISQIFYPGWQVTIDGQSADLLRTNVVQQGVVVPPGEHTIEIFFSPRTFNIGVVVSLTALIICGGLLLISHLKRN